MTSVTREQVLEAAKVAALALKDWGCWDSVVKRSGNYFDMANKCGWVRSGDVNGKDEFPFLWAFDEANIRTKHEREMVALQWALARELRLWADRLENPKKTDDCSKLPPRKRFREQTKTTAPSSTKLMMRFSASKVQRVSEEQQGNKAIFV